MGLFGPKKTPEEKQKELEELERQIKEQEEAKKRKKAKKSGKVIEKEPEPVEEKEQVKSSGLSGIDINRIRDKRKHQDGQSREDFVKKIASHKIQEQKESQKMKEIISRLKSDDLEKIVNLLNSSKDIYDFYDKGIKEFNPDVFIALGIITPTEQELFQYIYKNNLSSELYQGDVSLLNKAYIQSQKEKFQEFARKHEKMLNSIKSGKEQFYEERTKNLPTLYILGDDRDYELVQVMSLPAIVKPIFDDNDLDIFEKDQNEKCVVLFKNANPVLSLRYQDIKAKQKFKILLSFSVSSDMKMNNEVVPFNRDNLLSKLI